MRVMNSIASFRIDHTKLTKGLYVSREDEFFMSCVTTFDLRMKTPYVDVPLAPKTAHTLEHCLATYLRNKRDDVIYVGPMGCMTGFYVVVYGKKAVENILDSLIGAFKWVLGAEFVPGATKEECGNYTFMDLEDAKREAAEYLKVLEGKTLKKKYE